MPLKSAFASISQAYKAAAPTSIFATVIVAAFLTAITPEISGGYSDATGKAWAQRISSTPGKFMSVTDAHQMALQKKLILLDIRRPSEWRQSGIPATATALTMHQSAARFFGGLNALTLMDKSKPIGLICATGVRTTYLQKILRKQGHTNIINVAEGMFGSRHGKGWIKTGLPIKQYGKGGTSSTPVPKK